jgi:SAM-dependent methyltransferase
MAKRLHSFGCDVVAVDRTAEGFEAGLPHVSLDFDQNDFASELSPASFDLVTAIEVIEHVESPIGFLRNIGRLLAPRGIAVITTPNVDSLPARAKFLLTGKIRTMDEISEPTHISPIFWGLLRRQLPLRHFRVIPFSGTTIFWSWKPVSNLECANRYVKTKQLSALLTCRRCFQDEDSLRSPSIRRSLCWRIFSSRSRASVTDSPRKE